MKRDNTDKDVWSSLTWDDLEQWAGIRSVARGRAYQQQNRVEDLTLRDDNRLLATVLGTQPYVVTAQIVRRGHSNTLQSTCSCPVGDDGCKHAVAAVIARLKALAGGVDLPQADPDDPRWDILSGHAQFPDEQFDDEAEPELDEARAAEGRSSDRQNRPDWDRKIREYLHNRSCEELAELVWSLAQRLPELRDEFRERITLSEGDVGKLVALARRELREMTSIQPWRSSWSGEGQIPDYTRLKNRLERLTQSGYADEVVSLGRELIDRGLEQVSEAHDEGDTAMALSECLPVVFEAVVRSSLREPEKILLTIDALLKDDYNVIGDAADVVLDANHSPTDWSVVADELAERLEQAARPTSNRELAGAGDSFVRDYQRDQISNWLLESLKRAERKDELLPIYEHEARATCSYQRLVDYLIAEGDVDSARRWAREGIEKTAREYPGIASGLAESMCEIARRRKQWTIVAAHAAWRFFARPGIETFEKLCAAARKARCLRAVRQAALRFLETGRSPIQIATVKEGANESNVNTDAQWPLPVPEELAILSPRANTMTEPYFDVLVDIAIAAKRPTDVLRWYDRMREFARDRRGNWLWRIAGYPDRVAAAVAESHPDRALDIYDRAIDAHLGEAKQSAYEAIGAYLRKLRPILRSIGRESEWEQRVADLREQYRRRPRFLEVLDTLEGEPIIQARDSHRRSG